MEASQVGCEWPELCHISTAPAPVFLFLAPSFLLWLLPFLLPPKPELGCCRTWEGQVCTADCREHALEAVS